MDANPAQLGNHLKELRARHGFTQATLAEAVGVTRKTINTVENQVFTPSALLALKLAEALQEPVDEVFFLIRKE
jgi:putative transcriptional regulator